MCEPRTLHMAVWSRPTYRQRSARAVVADKGARFRNFHYGACMARKARIRP
jgi:hypothetical protein